MKQKESIIEKIKKLLALSDRNTNAQEALSAALKAQKLIAEYDISEEDLLDESSRSKLIEVTAALGSKTSMYGQLAAVVANNFRCKAYLKKNFANGKTEAVFYGYDLDAKAAERTFSYLFKTMDREGRREERKTREETGTGSGVYNWFAKGFISGVREELEKQSRALMLVVSEDVEKGWDDLSKNFKAARRPSMSYSGQSLAAHSRGVTIGKDAIQASRLNGQMAING